VCTIAFKPGLVERLREENVKDDDVKQVMRF
jgi:hypothetical protein